MHSPGKLLQCAQANSATATHGNALQHIATHCNTLQYTHTCALTRRVSATRRSYTRNYPESISQVHSTCNHQRFTNCHQRLHDIGLMFVIMSFYHSHSHYDVATQFVIFTFDSDRARPSRQLPRCTAGFIQRLDEIDLEFVMVR